MLEALAVSEVSFYNLKNMNNFFSYTQFSILHNNPIKNNKLNKLFSLALYLFISSFCIYITEASAEVKIVTVDVSRILNESKEAKIKRSELDTVNLDAKKKIESRKAVLKSLEDKLKEKKLSEDSKEVENFKSQAREFERLVKDTQDDLKEKFLKTNKVLTEKALNLIKDFAEAKKIDLVLDKSQAQRGPVLFGSPDSDITNEIILKMNQ